MRFALFSVYFFCTIAAAAREDKADTLCASQRFNLHFQTTYVYQYKPAFSSPYAGTNSLAGTKENQNSLTATMFMGARLWRGAELYINPELAGGSGLSGALGMAGSSNGETFRVGNPSPTLYLARAFLKQTISLGQANDCTEEDANQLSGSQPKDYLRFYAGKYSLGDMFDNNDYSNSPKEQFMNWSLMNNGAWDYAANVRGYTFAFTTELQLRNMNYKIAIATLPLTANGGKLNTDLSEALAINAEIVRSYTLNNRPGHMRLIAYHNRANMGNYALSIKYPLATDTPDLTSTRIFSRDKNGIGLNIDQQLSSTLGIFARIGWNDGKNETWCFTEIDRSLTAGLDLDGKGWKRPDDNGGIAIALNGISKDHRNYLAKGGNGFIIGDGGLNYAPEAIAELYYNVKPVKLPIWISGDYQFCINPGYNKDRGPVNIFSLRVHVAI